MCSWKIDINGGRLKKNPILNKNHKKIMGRKKIQISRITDERNRQVRQIAIHFVFLKVSKFQKQIVEP